MTHTKATFAAGLFCDFSVAITGGGTGIGRQTAIAFAALGARVSICGRRAEMLDQTCKLADAAALAAGHAHRVHAATCDVKDPAMLGRWRDAALHAHGHVDAVVVNAGANFLAPAASITPNGFATVIGTILQGTWNTVHAWYPHLSERGCSHIVMMAATNGATSSPLMAHSGAGKAGMLNLTQTLAVEWAAQGIRVNAVAPGPVDSEGANQRLWADAEARARVEATVPLGRMGNVDDCANAVLFLCSPAARFMTGSVLTIDGGNSLKSIPPLFG
jgi:NAD(P)-dependent dehydrogenase (short-subunit alcohol dehydrogenase family)